MDWNISIETFPIMIFRQGLVFFRFWIFSLSIAFSIIKTFNFIVYQVLVNIKFTHQYCFAARMSQMEGVLIILDLYVLNPKLSMSQKKCDGHLFLGVSSDSCILSLCQDTWPFKLMIGCMCVRLCFMEARLCDLDSWFGSDQVQW